MTIDRELLRRRRREIGLSQEKLALLSGYSRTAIQLIESGTTTRSTPATIRAIERVLDLPAGSLYLKPAASEASADGTRAESRFGNLPPAPPIVVGRSESLEEVRRRLQGDAGAPPVGVQRLVAIHGLPGVGKTTVASLLARDVSLEAAFPDGVLWSSLGESSDPVATLLRWCRACNLRVPAGDPHAPNELSERLSLFLRDKRALVMVDDLWSAQDLTLLRVGGPDCATLVTTRQPGVADEVAVEANVYRLEVLTETESLELFYLLAPATAREYPETCRAVVRAVEGLPLAIQVAAALLRAEARRGFGVMTLLESLQKDDSLVYGAPAQTASNETTATVARLLKRSTDRLSKEARYAFACLAVLAPKPAVFDEELAGVACAPADPRVLLAELVDRGLVEVHAMGRYQIHRLLQLHAESLQAELDGHDALS